MKSFIKSGLFIISMFFAFGLSAQHHQTMSGSGDSVENTGTKYLTQTLNGNLSAVTIMVSFTKASGTVAGKATIEYSIDGVNYFRINTDSLNLTNTATQYKMFIVTPPGNYTHVRVKIVGSGTSKFYPSGTYYYRKQ